MKIKSTLVIEIEAEDFVTAGKHQANIQELIDPILKAYPQATVSFNQIKRRTSSPAQRPAMRMASSTGHLNRYDR